jgi:hypothetical protein
MLLIVKLNRRNHISLIMPLIPTLISEGGMTATQFIIYGLKTHPIGIVAIFTITQGLFTDLSKKGYRILQNRLNFAIITIGTTFILGPFLIDWTTALYEWTKDRVGDLSDDVMHYLSI